MRRETGTVRGAVMSYTAADGDLRGTAATACQRPANDLWLVGANTAVGRTAVLNLSNASAPRPPSAWISTAPRGPSRRPGAAGCWFAPGTTRSVILAGLAPGRSS